jgi:terpene synthase-like protein
MTSTDSVMTEPVICFDIPAIYCPFPLVMHPKVDELGKAGMEFMTRYGFCGTERQMQMVVGTDSNLFYASISPDGLEERMQVAVDWCYLMFAFDDLRCDMGEISERPGEFAEVANRLLRTLEAPDSGAMGNDVFAAPVRDIAQRVHAMGSPTQVRRWIDGHYMWFLGVLWEIAWRASRTMPRLDDYLHARLRYCAGAPTTAWIEFVNAIDLPGREMNASRVRALTEMTWMIAALDDDLVSYGKDLWYTRRASAHREKTQSSPNIIDVIVAQEHYSLAEAATSAVALRDCITSRFLEVREQLLGSEVSPMLVRYVTDLGNLLRGNVEYGITARRYSNPDGATPGAIQMTCPLADSPSRARFMPSAIPSLRWWWTL